MEFQPKRFDPPHPSVTDIARESLEANARALTLISERLGETDAMERAVEAITTCEGRVIISGIGKSGLIGRKISATMTSLGTPSLWLHSTEAMHGDLGHIRRGDVAILISGSGETKEVVTLIPFLKRTGVPYIAITANVESTLAKHAVIVLDGSVERESCHMNLAPTTSTLVALGLGDALAVAVASKRGIQPSDFALNHPGGKLGERLLTPVREIMRRENLPVAGPKQSLREVIEIVTRGGIGTAIVTDGDAVQGVITDGDLRRAIQALDNLDETRAEDIMTRDPLSVSPDAPMFDADMKMRQNRVTTLMVTDESGAIAGIVSIHD